MVDLFLSLTLARGQIVLKQLFQATWKTYRTRFDPLIANIHDHGMLVQNQATLAQIEECRRDRLANCHQHEAYRLRELYTWLRSPDQDQASNAENDQYEYARVRKDCPGSGSWVLSKQAFNEWMDPAFPAIPPLLWINGVPGAGRFLLSYCISLNRPTTVLIYSSAYLPSARQECLDILHSRASKTLIPCAHLVVFLLQK